MAKKNPIDGERSTHVGVSWNSREGRRSVVGEEEIRGRTMLAVRTEGQRLTEFWDPATLDAMIRVEESTYQNYLRDMAALEAREAEEEREKEKRADLRGFEKRFTKVQLQRALSVLDRKVRLEGRVGRRREHIERLVREGYYLKEHPDFGRILVDPRGEQEGFWEQKTLTKIGLDYAAYLIESDSEQTRSNPKKRAKKKAPKKKAPKKKAAKKRPRSTAGMSIAQIINMAKR